MKPFLLGAIAMACMIAALFFFRFWRRTDDALFAFFAFAFWLLAAVQALTAFATVPLEERTWLYLLRLAAFILILAGILLKNRRAR